MSEDRKKPGVAFWATVVVVVVLAYTLSIGPGFLLAIQIAVRPGPDREWPMEVVNTMYAPVLRLAAATNSRKPVVAYIEWWMRRPSSPEPRSSRAVAPASTPVR